MHADSHTHTLTHIHTHTHTLTHYNPDGFYKAPGPPCPACLVFNYVDGCPAQIKWVTFNTPSLTFTHTTHTLTHREHTLQHLAYILIVIQRTLTQGTDTNLFIVVFSCAFHRDKH